MGTRVLDRVVERGQGMDWLRHGIGDNGRVPTAVRQHRSCATDGPDHDHHRTATTPVERSPDPSPRNEGTLCGAVSDRPDDRRNECATTTASETEHHCSVEHPPN